MLPALPSLRQDDVAALRASAAVALQQVEEAGGGSAAGVVAQVGPVATGRSHRLGAKAHAAQGVAVEGSALVAQRCRTSLPYAPRACCLLTRPLLFVFISTNRIVCSWLSWTG